MSAWASADELRGDVTALLERFAATPEGAAAAAAAKELGDGLAIELSLHDPDVLLQLDLGSGTISDGPCPDAAVRVALPAADMHDLLLERLGPVEISRLVEEHRLHLTGAPAALCAAVVICAQLQPHYAPTLRERGREHLLETPAPATGEIWQSAEKPAPVFGVRRPWQAPKGARA
jgi:hypothetical protein